MSDLDNNLREHSVDGIQEYDNNLPRWWVWSFILSIIWAAGYIVHYHWLSLGALGVEALQEEERIVREIRIANSKGELSEELLAEMSHDQSAIDAGAAAYVKGNCAMCHGAEAYGLVGPNLRDDYWVYGSSMKDIVKTISEGRVNPETKQVMPPQSGTLSPDDIMKLAAYLANLSRTTPKTDHKTAKGMKPLGELAPIEY